ncbi:MAG: hypothetical protein PGN08_10945 [Sphingomonas taxi]
MGVLNHLIAPRRPGRKQLGAALRSPLGALLLAQFERLGLGAGAVPADGATGSAWSRGYVLGAACASLQQQAGGSIGDRECFAAALAAFSMTYGEEQARNILAATIAAAEAKEPEVEDGLLQGASDLAALAMGEADAATLAFATRNGEDVEIL